MKKSIFCLIIMALIFGFVFASGAGAYSIEFEEGKKIEVVALNTTTSFYVIVKDYKGELIPNISVGCQFTEMYKGEFPVGGDISYDLTNCQGVAVFNTPSSYEEGSRRFATVWVGKEMEGVEIKEFYYTSDPSFPAKIVQLKGSNPYEVSLITANVYGDPIPGVVVSIRRGSFLETLETDLGGEVTFVLDPNSKYAYGEEKIEVFVNELRFIKTDVFINWGFLTPPPVDSVPTCKLMSTSLVIPKPGGFVEIWAETTNAVSFFLDNGTGAGAYAINNNPNPGDTAVVFASPTKTTTYTGTVFGPNGAGICQFTIWDSIPKG